MVVLSMVLGAVPAQLFLAPVAASSDGNSEGDNDGGQTRGLLPSDETFQDTNFRAIDSTNNSKNDAIEARYTVRTTAVQEQVTVLIKAMDGNGRTVKFHYDNFTAFLFGNQQRTWTFYAHYTGFYRVSLTLFDSQDNQEASTTSGVFSLDTGKVQRWITIDTKDLDLDSDSYKDDVEVHVTNWTGKDVSGAQVWANGTILGKTNAQGKITGRNYPKGWINIDAFTKNLHNSTAWYSEGDGSIVKGFSVRADPFDSDDDGLEDDVEITVRNQLNLPVRNVQINVNGTDYGTTDAQGILEAFNFRKGFWIVNASKLNNFGSTSFYSEGTGPGTDVDEYFFDWELSVVDLDKDDRVNDVRVRVDVDVDPAVSSNVTVWANFSWANNFTGAFNVSSNFTTNGTETDWHNIDIKNITYGRYWVQLVLLDSYNNTEDWAFSVVQLVRPSNHVNIETGVHYGEGDQQMDDVLFRAFRVDEGEPKMVYSTGPPGTPTDGSSRRDASSSGRGSKWRPTLPTLTSTASTMTSGSRHTTTSTGELTRSR
jgi:hypothetical protein